MKLRRKNDVQKPPHKKHKSKKKFKRVLLFIKFILVAALLATTVVYTAISPFFNINTMMVKGNAHYDRQTLTAASGIVQGNNGFRQMFEKPGKFYFLRIGLAEKSIIESCPYVKNVKVRFLIPSAVMIEVEEREAAALVNITGTTLLIDREGILLEMNPEIREVVLPVIKGIKSDTFSLGKKINIKEDALLSVFNIFDTIREMDNEKKDKLLPSVDYIDIGDMNNVTFSLQSRVIVNLGKPKDLNYKINAVKTIFTKNIKKSDRGKLDFSLNKDPVFTPENGG